MIQLRTSWDKRGSLGIDLYQQYKELVNKWLGYGNFPPERLCDSIQNHMRQKGMLGCLFVPKISKIGQDLAELWPFYPERLRDSIENHMDKKWII